MAGSAVGLPLRLRFANASDVPAMLAIFDRAFAEDDHTQLKIAWRGAAAMRNGMATALGDWLGSPVEAVLVAEDASAAIVGWACWSTADPKRRRIDPATVVAASESKVEELERITTQDIRHGLHRVGEEYGVVDVLVSIVVDPVVQARGVGSSLIDWGVQRADAAGRACWVHASASGARAFVRHGFAVDRERVIDLSLYAPRHDSHTWGIVRFCSMTRPPRVRSDRPSSCERQLPGR